MARILITGSSDGLGSLAARALVKKGHRVVLHARNAQRAADASAACPGAETVLVADLSSLSETKRLAEEANKLGRFDVVIHNAALYRSSGFDNPSSKKYNAADEWVGVPPLVAVNTLAPYVLTALMLRPKRMVYVSSGLHNGGDVSLRDWTWKQRGAKSWSDSQGYANSKLQIIMMSNAMARKWPSTLSHSLDPGWMPTKMGGASAPGNMDDAVATYVLLATADENTIGNGKYWYHSEERKANRATDSQESQERLLQECEEITGVKLPKADESGHL